MTQSRAMSLFEAVVDVTIGYGIAVATHLVLFPGLRAPRDARAEPEDRRGLRHGEHRPRPRPAAPVRDRPDAGWWIDPAITSTGPLMSRADETLTPALTAENEAPALHSARRTPT